MKKYCILLCCLLSTIIIHGQIKLSSQAEKHPEKIAFDNSRNWQGEHYRNTHGNRPRVYFSIISSVVGIAIIALPSGIVTAGYMNELKQRKKVDEKDYKENRYVS